MNEDRRVAARAQLVEIARATASRRTSRSRTRVIAGVLAIAVGATVAASWTITRAVADPTIVECRTSISPESSGVFVSGPEGLSTETESGASAAISLCSTGWETGIYEAGQQPVIPTSIEWQPPAEISVPPLAVCVAPDGHAVVVPAQSSKVCSGIGLASPEGAK